MVFLLVVFRKLCRNSILDDGVVTLYEEWDLNIVFRLQQNDVVLRVTTSAICGSDLHMYMGAMPGMKSGDVVGHEFMGVVEAVGPAVEGIKEGKSSFILRNL